MKATEIITIPVTNQERSKEFYQKIGFQLISEIPIGNGQTWVQLALPGEQIGISLMSWFPFKEVAMTPGALQGIIFETDDIERDVQELKKNGIEIGVMRASGFEPGKIDNLPWGKFTHFMDPDGNGLSLHQK